MRCIDTYGQNKVLFGTDFSVLQLQCTVHEINQIGLRAGPSRKLMRNNAVKLFKLGMCGLAP